MIIIEHKLSDSFKHLEEQENRKEKQYVWQEIMYISHITE